MLALATAATLVAPASAHAAFAKIDSAGKLSFSTIPGEANRLAVAYPAPGTVQLGETGHLGPFPIVISGSGGCTGIAALIPCTGFTSVNVNTGDGDDTVAARNGSPEKITCGSGNDSVTADPADTVASDCESVDRAASTAPAGQTNDPGSSNPGTPPQDPSTPPGATRSDGINPNENLQPPAIPAQTAAVTASGVALVQVVCPPEAGACRGSVDLILLGGTTKRGRMAAAAAAPKGTKIGSAKFAAKAGAKPIVHIRLNRRGRQRILRHRHTRCRVVVTTRSATGGKTVTTRTITLRPRRSQGRKH